MLVRRIRSGLERRQPCNQPAGEEVTSALLLKGSEIIFRILLWQPGLRCSGASSLLAIIQNPTETSSELSPVFKAYVYQLGRAMNSLGVCVSGTSALCDARKG